MECGVLLVDSRLSPLQIPCCHYSKTNLLRQIHLVLFWNRNAAFPDHVTEIVRGGIPFCVNQQHLRSRSQSELITKRASSGMLHDVHEGSQSHCARLASYDNRVALQWDTVDTHPQRGDEIRADGEVVRAVLKDFLGNWVGFAASETGHDRVEISFHSMRLSIFGLCGTI